MPYRLDAIAFDGRWIPISRGDDGSCTLRNKDNGKEYTVTLNQYNEMKLGRITISRIISNDIMRKGGHLPWNHRKGRKKD